MLLLVLIVIAAVVWLLIAQPWSGKAEPTQAAQEQAAQPLLPAVSSSPESGSSATATSAPGPTTSSSSTKSPSPGASAVACSANDVTVKAVTDKSSYASDEEPKLSIELINESDHPCTLNVGTSAQVFTITSGSDTWWRSTDCQSEPSDMVVVLDAGQKVSSAEPITWDRTRSSVATCQAKNRPHAAGGGATYHLAVQIGGIDSIDDAVFQLY